jgi:hypothetical protein
MYRTTYSVAMCCASAALPPFPQKKERASALHRLLHHAMRTLEVGTEIGRDAFRRRSEVAQSIGEW